MRKFTKEISALLASAAVGATVYAGAVSASSEQMGQSEGVMAAPDETIEPTSEEYFAGGLMADPTENITEPTTDEFPPLGGVPLPPDDFIYPTEEPTIEEFPPLAGEPMPPDEFIEPTEEPTTEEEIPPLAGDVAPADGDINGDGSFGISDVVLLQKWLLSDPDAEIINWRAADLNYDNRLDVFDLCLMKKALIEKNNDHTQNIDTSFSLKSVNEIRSNWDGHREWKGYVVRSENELNDIITENEDISAQDIIEAIDKDLFNDKSLVVIYSPSGAGNRFSIIAGMTVKNNEIIVSAVTKSPMIATPDMMYRRYIYCIDKNSAANINNISFNDTVSSYQHEEGNAAAEWYRKWLSDSKQAE